MLTSKGFSETGDSGIHVTTLLGMNNSGNIEGIKLIFFFKMVNVLFTFQTCNRKSAKSFWF